MWCTRFVLFLSQSWEKVFYIIIYIQILKGYHSDNFDVQNMSPENNFKLGCSYRTKIKLFKHKDDKIIFVLCWILYIHRLYEVLLQIKLKLNIIKVF